jgi:diguanylate cyclase (GGDEF)-like protein
VYFLDLDGFKDVNDTYGHDIGDRVLSVVARRLADAVRPTDLVGRVGGDEFVVVCEPASMSVLRAIARRIDVELERPIELAGLPAITTGATVGLAVADAVDDTASLLRRADDEMYRSKAERRLVPRPIGPRTPIRSSA